MHAKAVVGDEDHDGVVENDAISLYESSRNSSSEVMARADAADDEAGSTEAVDEA